MSELLLEYMPFDVNLDVINESIAQNKPLVVEGLLQRKDAKNKNGRRYPGPILESAIEDYISTYIKENRALGELGHPKDRIEVEPALASHRILELYWKGDELYGKIMILTTPNGNILKELYKCGVKMGISSRALGSVKEVYNEQTNEKDLIVENLKFSCWDFVHDPSTYGAYPTLKESTSGILESNYEKIDTLFSQIICDIEGICKVCNKK